MCSYVTHFMLITLFQVRNYFFIVIILQVADEIGFNLHYYFILFFYSNNGCYYEEKIYTSCGYRINNMFEKKGILKVTENESIFKRKYGQIRQHHLQKYVVV